MFLLLAIIAAMFVGFLLLAVAVSVVVTVALIGAMLAIGRAAGALVAALFSIERPEL